MVNDKLARKLTLRLNEVEIDKTPILVPSFSSRANINVGKMINMTRDAINGPILISAYDVHYGNLPEITTNLIFLDSGGYECAIDKDISEMGYNVEPPSWDLNKYLETVENWMDMISTWENPPKTALISYDHPLTRETIQEQVENAKKIFNNFKDVLKEFLIKPERLNDKKINVDNLIKNIDLLASFDIIGITEKELGSSVFERMVNISKIRKELDRKHIEVPVHIFGSLDTITTPLYYFAGADIFDGLSWLRYTFHEGDTYYTSSAGPKLQSIHKNMSRIQARSLDDNITYILRLKVQLEEYYANDSFDHFGETNSKLFNEAYNQLKAK